jgi:hypothetical protein
MADMTQSPSKQKESTKARTSTHEAREAARAAQEAEVREPRPYDNPRLTAIQFLEAVMHDPTVNLYSRMKAADMLMRLDLPQHREPSLFYQMEGISVQ